MNEPLSDGTRRLALVVGATGVVGRRLAEHLHALGDWRVVGLCRSPSNIKNFETIAVDLTDRGQCLQALESLGEVTHIFYAARFDHVTTAPEPIATNLEMLRNVLDAVEPRAKALRHVHLVHGMKVYGATLGPFKTPARESDPRVLADNFYYAQEDLIADRQRGKCWTWSTSRPQGVCDSDHGIARSMAKLIAVYATISSELGMPLCFPGNPKNYTSIYQCTETTQLAKAITWISTEPRCANQSFNVTNGDYIRWANVWPAFARYFEMQLGSPRPIRLGDTMPDKGAAWARIVEKHRLQSSDYAKLVIWPYGDFIFGSGYDQMSDLTKLRTLGFQDVVDTEQMFLTIFDRFRSERVIP